MTRTEAARDLAYAFAWARYGRNESGSPMIQQVVDAQARQIAAALLALTAPDAGEREDANYARDRRRCRCGHQRYMHTIYTEDNERGCDSCECENFTDPTAPPRDGQTGAGPSTPPLEPNGSTAFEAWHTAVFGHEREDGTSAFARTPLGFYRDDRVMMRYQGWQAALLFARAENAESLLRERPEPYRWTEEALAEAMDDALVAHGHSVRRRGISFVLARLAIRGPQA